MHVLLKFSLLLALASVLSHVKLHGLLIVATLSVIVAYMLNAQVLWKMLRRVKWLIIVLLTIYAFTTPGQYVTHDFTTLLPILLVPSFLVPSYEGVAAGIQQALNIITMVAGLSVLMSTTSTSCLMAGLYQCLLPLRRLGFAPETFAARLWLTLHYVESNFAVRAQGGRRSMMQAFSQIDQMQLDAIQAPEQREIADPQHVTIQLIPLTELDKRWIIAILMAIAMLWII